MVRIKQKHPEAEADISEGYDNLLNRFPELLGKVVKCRKDPFEKVKNQLAKCQKNNWKKL